MTREKRKTPNLYSEVLTGSDTEKGHCEKLRRYSSAKKHSTAVADFIVTNEPLLFKEADLLQACSSWLIFRHFYTANEYRMIGGCTCKKHLLCAMCALRRSAKTVKEYEKKVNQVLAENPGLVPVLLTLTVKNGLDLHERTRHLDGALSRIINNRRRSEYGDRHTTSFRAIHGAAGAFEFKRGAGSGLWHPHVHLVALVKSETDLLDLEWNISEEWRKQTKDSFNVDITPIDTSTDESRFKAICEVFRYALKFGEMEIEDQVHAYKVLRGKRLVRSFGSLYGVQVSDDLNDTIEDELALKPYIDLVYEYSKNKGYFLKDAIDTGDLFTSSTRPAMTEGTKQGRRLSSRLFLQVKDFDRPGRTRSLDQEYMNSWIDEAGVEVDPLPEVPF